MNFQNIICKYNWKEIKEREELNIVSRTIGKTKYRTVA